MPIRSRFALLGAPPYHVKVIIKIHAFRWRLMGECSSFVWTADLVSFPRSAESKRDASSPTEHTPFRKHRREHLPILGIASRKSTERAIVERSHGLRELLTYRWMSKSAHIISMADIFVLESLPKEKGQSITKRRKYHPRHLSGSRKHVCDQHCR